MDLCQGWYVRKVGSEENHGPYLWDDLVSFARTGSVVADDWVWHEYRADWTPAASITELAQQFPKPPQPATAPAQPAPATAQSHSASESEQNPWGLIAVLIGLLVVVLGIGAGGVGWWLHGRSGGGPRGGSELGEAYVKLPDPASVVRTDQWGEVPAGQIGITLVEDGKRKDAEKVAEDIGGTIVGEIEFINLYQIEFPGATEAELISALDQAKADEAVGLAFPNPQAYSRREIWGVRQDPYADPMYGGAVGGNYKTLGVSRAWDYIRGSGVELSEVNVGVVDDGLYIRGEGAESEFGGKVKIEYPDGEENGKIAAPRVANGAVNEAGSHGTGVATVIGGDPDNGGPAGIAGPLGEKLTLSITNYQSGNYGLTTTTPDPEDPTKTILSDGQTYAIGNLVALQKQVESGATVINCSWGADLCHPDVAAVYKKFFEKMAAEHDDVVFVFAAGNTDQTALDNRTSFPCGHPLDNMLTVAAVNNDGNPASYTTIAGDNYVVDIAATGTKATVGLDAKGGPVQQSGTSFAAPEVAAAAAMLKAIDPDLKAADIKRILTETARTTIKTGDNEVATPDTVGGRVLAVDEAVFKALNQKRVAEGLPELSAEQMGAGGVVDAVAITGAPGEYTVKGIVKAAAQGSAKLAIVVTGSNNAVGGPGGKSVSAPGEASWSVTLPENKGTIVVTRADNGAASVITVDQGALEGTWEYPETMRVAGSDRHFKTGAMIKMDFVQAGDGYALTGSYADAEVTVEGDKVKVVYRYAGLLPGETGGTMVFSGTIDGDTITGTMVDTYNGQMEWIATRVK